MSDKYIIRNCPAFYPLMDRNEYMGNDGQCQNYDDCILKQIVKKCKKSLEVSYCPIEQEILQLLDIQEVK